MSLWNIIFSIAITYLIVDMGKAFLTKQSRNGIKIINKRKDDLRNKLVKTLEEQKEYSALCYPPKTKIVFTFKTFLFILLFMAIFISIMMSINFLLSYFKIVIQLWMLLVLIFILPVILNYILSKFGLQKHNALFNILRLLK